MAPKSERVPEWDPERQASYEVPPGAVRAAIEDAKPPGLEMKALWAAARRALRLGSKALALARRP